MLFDIDQIKAMVKKSELNFVVMIFCPDPILHNQINCGLMRAGFFKGK
jgi:hypothetical protein